eukprot:gene4918-8506_t
MKNKTLEEKYTFKFLALLKSSKIKEAVDTFEEIKQHGFNKNIHFYNLLIQEYMATSDIEKSTKLFEEMKKNDIKPDVNTLNSLMYIHYTRGEGGKMLKIFETFGDYDVSPNTMTFYLIISESITQKNIDTALNLYELMKESKIPISSNIYGILIQATAETKEFKIIQNLITECLESGHSIDEMYPSLLMALWKDDNILGAERVFEVMESLKLLSLQVYGIMIKGYSDHKMMDKAQELFDQILAKDIQPDTIVVLSMIYGYSKLDNEEAFKEFILTLRHHKITDRLPIFNKISIEGIKELDQSLINSLSEEEMKLAKIELDQVQKELELHK